MSEKQNISSDPKPGQSQVRLNVFLASAGVSSRRGGDRLIKAGRVSINGRQGQLNDNVSDTDDIKVNGRRISRQTSRYILLFKPAGYITTLKDTNNRVKVTDLVKINERVVPVGRLDFNTTGALLLTNDGQLANKLMHPSYEIDKVYEVEVNGHISSQLLKKLSKGIKLDGYITAPAKVRQLSVNKIEIIIHEGRNQQVKRMLKACGLSVTRLHRPKYGPLVLAGLKPGRWRDLSDSELKLLK